MQEHCPPEKLLAIRHSLLAAVLTFASRYSLPFPDLPICRLHDLPTTWLGRSLALPLSRLSSCASFLSRCLRKRSLLKQAGKNWRAHLLMRRKFFGSAGALPSRKTIRYSPFATRCCFNIRHSLFAAVSRLADLPTCRFADKIRLGRSLALPLFALQKSHPPVANCQSPLAFTIRHSLLATRLSSFTNRQSLPFCQLSLNSCRAIICFSRK